MNEEEWLKYYQEQGISVETHFSEQTGLPIGITAFIGEQNVRVLKVIALHGKSCAYWDRATKTVLRLLHLSEDYPWIVCTPDSFSIFFRCISEERVINRLPILWETTESVPGINPKVAFYNNRVPEHKPSFIEYDVVQHCMEVYRSKLPQFDAVPPMDVPDILPLEGCRESWSLKEFMKKSGPKMQIGYYPMRNNNGETFVRCRFGDTNRQWVYCYVSLRLGKITVKDVQAKKDTLRVCRNNRGNYILYDTGHHISWENVPLDFSDISKKNYDFDDFVIVSENGFQGLSLRDGTIVINPIFYKIEKGQDCFVAVGALRDSHFSIYPKTYGEGLICCEKHDEDIFRKYGYVHYWPNIQSYIDKSGKTVVSFNKDWFDKNELGFRCTIIKPGSICYYKDGFLEVEIMDGDIGRNYRIDKQGNAEYVGPTYYDGPEDADIDDFSWDGYEERDYYNIGDEGLREVFDDNPEMLGNID